MKSALSHLVMKEQVMFKYIIGGLTAISVFTGFGAFPNLYMSDFTSPSAAYANTITDASSINGVYFKRGRLIQTNKAQGLWTEYDSRGTERYTFETLSYSANSLVLKGRKGNVRLVVNFIDNIISGEWPGHPMGPLYEITRVDRVLDTQTTSVTEKPTLVTVPDKTTPPATVTPPRSDTQVLDKDNTGKAPVATLPNTIPPGKNPDSTDVTPVTVAQVPNPSILTRASYEFGSFEKLEGQDWIEKTQSGYIFNYKKIGHNQRSVFLYDTSRSAMIEIDLQENTIRSGISGDGLRPLYDIIDAGNETPSTDPTPLNSNQTGTKLSYLERTSCRLKGGKVERAGLLENERCTLTYEDGGNICIDSSNCEGLCISTLKTDETAEAVGGTCQLNDNPFGCYSEVIAGQATPTLCVD